MFLRAEEICQQPGMRGFLESCLEDRGLGHLRGKNREQKLLGMAEDLCFLVLQADMQALTKEQLAELDRMVKANTDKTDINGCFLEWLPNYHEILTEVMTNFQNGDYGHDVRARLIESLRETDEPDETESDDDPAESWRQGASEFLDRIGVEEPTKAKLIYFLENKPLAEVREQLQNQVKGFKAKGAPREYPRFTNQVRRIICREARPYVLP